MMLNNVFIKIGYNTGIQILGKSVSWGLGIFTILLLTRYLGTKGYGNFTLAFTYVSFFATIADFGLQLAMVRELSQKKQKEKEYGTFLWIKIILVLFSSLLADLILFFFPYSFEVKIGILIAIAAVTVSGVTNYGNIIFQSRIRLDLITIIDILVKIFTVGFIVLFVLLKFNFYYIVSTILMGNVIGLFITIFFIKDTIFFSYDFRLAKQIILLSLPIGVSTFLALAYFKIDTIMLSIMKGSSEVGLYSLAYKILENLILLWGFYMASVYPLLAQLKDNKEKLRFLVKNSFFLAILGSIPIIIIGFILAPLVINFFGGKAFNAAIPSLRILLFSIPFLFINSLFYNLLIVLNKNKFILVGMSLSLTVNILLNLYYIPSHGFIGASYVTVFSALFLSTYYSIKIFDFIK